jgi:heat shock protein HtpX
VLDNVTEEMAIAAGIPKPKLYVIDDTSPNAFATGKNPETGVVCCTTGLLNKLNRDELQGVIAHEMSHIRNYDIRFMTTISLIAGLIPLLSDFLMRMGWFGGGRRSRDSDSNNGAQSIFMIVAIILAILAPIFSVLLQMAVSRKRELLADASAAELTRYPEGLASALRRISDDPEPLEAANRATQHLYIVNPLKRNTEQSSALFSTHPPIEERIEALSHLMGAFDVKVHAPNDFSDMPDIPDQH